MKRLAGAIAALLLAPAVAAADPIPEFIQLPPGYHIEEYAKVPDARTLLPVPELGVVFVGQRGSDVWAIVDADRDRRPEKVVRVLSGLNVANGIEWKDGWLYVAEQHQVIRVRARTLEEVMQAESQVLLNALPDNRWHGWRYVRFGPDGYLYVAVGAPCNICQVNGSEGTIIRLKPPASDAQPIAPVPPEIFARGVRNSVGFDFQPGTGHLFFTDNGADGMGDDIPPDELNLAPKAGLWFGFPWFGGGEDRTDAFKDQPLPATHTPPALRFGAHVASLGISFYRGGLFPPEIKGDAFVAHRGSWNRTVPDGYRVARVKFDKKSGKPLSWEPFITGFLRPDGTPWGRPVDVKELDDGSLLVSDNHREVVYRITYSLTP